MNYFLAAVVLVVGEVLSTFIFARLKRSIGPPESSPALKASVLKGMLERAVLLTGLMSGFPQILIAFGALKLGTRLHPEKESEVSNTYFLVGNLISILLAMVYAIVIGKLWNA